MSLSACSLPFTSSNGPIIYDSLKGRHVIVCLGDSLTRGHGAPRDQSYPAWLQQRLDALGYPYAVVNSGVDGNRAADGLARLQSDVLSFHPVIVAVALGANDASNTPTSVWQPQLETIVARLQARGIRVLLLGLDEPGLNDIYRAVATSYRVPLVWMTNGTFNRPGLWSDPHHPSGAGYKIVMENVWAALAPMLSRT